MNQTRLSITVLSFAAALLGAVLIVARLASPVPVRPWETAPQARLYQPAPNQPASRSTVAATSRDLAFVNGAVRLAGTLYLPAGPGPFPAVVVVHGSGPELRRVYAPDAQMLARAGVAAFIYDKRGTGLSGGDWVSATLEDLRDDALAAVQLLQAQPEVHPDQVGWLGSSQGAWLAPFAATYSSQVAFFVQVTGSATPLANQEMWGVGNALAAKGFSAHAIAAEVKAQHLLYSARDLIRAGVLPLGDLWFVHLDPYRDPASVWPAVDVPALVLYGGQDPTVPTATSLAILQPLLERHGHPDTRIVVFPRVAHALGGPARNADAVYAALVPAWIHAVTGGGPMPELVEVTSGLEPEGLRWYGPGAARTPWYATASMQLGLMLLFALGSLLSMAFSLWPAANLRLPARSLLPRFVLGLTGALNLALLVGLLSVLVYLLEADAASASPDVPLAGLLWVGTLFSVALSVAVAAVAITAWRGRMWSRVVLVGYTAGAALAVAFVGFLAYWQLPFGPL